MHNDAPECKTGPAKRTSRGPFPLAHRAAGVMLALFCTVAAVACSGGAYASAGAEPHAMRVWHATPGGQVLLVPLLRAGDAGWCMQTVTRIVTATSTVSSRACPFPPTSTGPIFAQTCNGGREGLFVFVLTTSAVASVSIAGGTRVPTNTNSTLPNGLREASLMTSDVSSRSVDSKHCPAVTPFDADGKALREHGQRGVPLMAQSPRRYWEHPEHPPRGACRLAATQLSPGTVEWEGAVATRIKTVPRLLGRALLSCASMETVHSGGHYICTAILLNASYPGATPPPLPGIKPLAGHPGIFEAPSAEGQAVARRISGAWLIATEETPSGLAATVELLEHLQAAIRL